LLKNVLLTDIKKEHIKSNLVFYISLILVTGSLFQVLSTAIFENNDAIVMKIPSIYGQEDDGGGDDGGDSKSLFKVIKKKIFKIYFVK